MTYSDYMKSYNTIARYYDTVRVKYKETGHSQYFREMTELDNLLINIKTEASIKQQEAWNEANRKTDELRLKQGLEPIYGYFDY
jgi:DNA-directed RNA polymerase alpha subunit